MPVCKECAYCLSARGLDNDHFEVSCFRKKRIRLDGKLAEFDNPGIEIKCSDYYKRIPNISAKETFDIQREEKHKEEEFNYAKKALEISSNANQIARDSKIWAIIAIIISVLTFVIIFLSS